MIQNIVRTELWESFGMYYPIDKKYREAGGLVLITAGGQYLYINGKRIHCLPGDAVYFRRGDKYRIELDSGKHIKCYVINFQCDLDVDAFVVSGCGDLAGKCAKILSACVRKREDEYCMLDAAGMLCMLLAEIFRRKNMAGIPMRKRERMAPAIKYIQDNFFSEDLRIGELADLCGMKERSFRRAFKEVCGVSPKRYVSMLKMKRAKQLLCSGHGVGEVAAMCGFRDVYHFSGFFKGECGVSPREYMNGAVSDLL